LTSAPKLYKVDSSLSLWMESGVAEKSEAASAQLAIAGYRDLRSRRVTVVTLERAQTRIESSASVSSGGIALRAREALNPLVS
jgi:hypothetical protein